MLASMDRGETAPFVFQAFAILFDHADGRECFMTDQLESDGAGSSEGVLGNCLFHDVSFLDHV